MTQCIGKYIWSNKEHRSINALNIVSLNYADSHSTFQLYFSIKMNDSYRKNNTLYVLIQYCKLYKSHKTGVTNTRGTL